MAIRFISENTAFKLKEKKKIKSWIRNVIEDNGKQLGEINYIFCGDQRILEINKQYLKHDYYTDIITFDYFEKDKLQADIFISIDTVESNSQKYNTSFEHELMRVIIHGILHLIGLDDREKKDKIKMREAENFALKLFYNTL
jgi:rRNA maturation RNase YbeY